MPKRKKSSSSTITIQKNHEYVHKTLIKEPYYRLDKMQDIWIEKYRTLIAGIQDEDKESRALH